MNRTTPEFSPCIDADHLPPETVHLTRSFRGESTSYLGIRAA